MLIQIGRVEMDLDDRQTARVLDRMHVRPVDLDVARMSVNLDFRGDPADEIIAATSTIHDVPLMTRARVIRQSRMVPFAASNGTTRQPET